MGRNGRECYARHVRGDLGVIIGELKKVDGVGC